MGLTLRTVKSLGLVLGSNVYTTLIQFLSRIILAWFLLPEAFGLFAIGFAVIGFLETFKGLGISAALVYRKEEIGKAANTNFWIEMAVSAVFFVLIFFSAPFIAGFFGDARIEWITRILALVFVFHSLGNVNYFLLEKQLKFKKTVQAQLVSYTAYFACAVFFAANGFGVWALVYGSVVLSVVNTLMLYLVFSWRPKLEFDKRIARELFGYGKFVLVSSVLTFLILNLDIGVVGKFLGMELLGFYSMALVISNLPAVLMSSVINRVMFPTYSSIRAEKEKLLAGFRKTLHYTCLVVFLLCFGLFALAPEFVSVVFGAKWAPMVGLMQVLALFGAVRVIGAVAGNFFLATGNPGLFAKIELLHLTILAVLILPAVSNAGAMGVAITVILACLFVNSLAIFKATRIAGERFSGSVERIGKPFLASIAMAAVLLFLKELMPGGLVSLVLLAVAGLTVYIAANIFLDRDLLKESKADFWPGIR